MLRKHLRRSMSLGFWGTLCASMYKVLNHLKPLANISDALISTLAFLKCLEFYPYVIIRKGTWKINKNVKGVRFASVPQTCK